MDKDSCSPQLGKMKFLWILIGVLFAHTAWANEWPIILSQLPSEGNIPYADNFHEDICLSDYVEDPEGEELYFYFLASDHIDNGAIFQKSNFGDGAVSTAGCPWIYRTTQEDGGLAAVVVQVSDIDNDDYIRNPTEAHRIVTLRFVAGVGDDTNLPVNDPPRVATPLQDTTMVRWSRLVVPLDNLSPTFLDPDTYRIVDHIAAHAQHMTRLSYRAEYSGPPGFSAYMKDQETVQLVAGEGLGTATVRVIATDPFGAEVTDTLTVRVVQETIDPPTPGNETGE